MASVANISLTLTEQTAIRFRLVNRMARGTNNIGLCVVTKPDVRPILIFRMATQAGIQSLTGRHLRKGTNRVLPPFRVHMLFTRSVATFTSGLVDRRVGQDTGLVMWIPEELERHIWMTCTAGVAAGVGIAGSGRFRTRWLCCKPASTQDGQQRKN